MYVCMCVSKPTSTTFQGIQLDPTKITYNQGLPTLANLMLNSFWGKYVLHCKGCFQKTYFLFTFKLAQQSNLRKTEQIDDPQKFFDYLTSDEVIVVDANLVSDDIMEIQCEYRDNFVEASPNTNVIIAAFTTTYTRLQLYDELDMLGERALYYDTDSVLYITQPSQPEPRLGIISVISPMSWAVTTLPCLPREDRKIIVTKPMVTKPKSKYVVLR